MSIAERKQRQKEEVRNSILQAAWQLIKDDGYQALSMRKIADAIDYSAPVIYSHFENKSALLHEFSKEGFRLLLVHLTAASYRYPADPVRQLEAIAQAYWEFAFSHQEHYHLMFGGMGIPSCDVARSVPEIGAFGEFIRTVIQAAVGKSNNPDADVFLKFHTYWSILHGLVSINLSGVSDTGPDRGVCILHDAIKGYILALKG